MKRSVKKTNKLISMQGCFVRRLAVDGSVAKVRSAGSAANGKALFRVSLPSWANESPFVRSLPSREAFGRAKNSSEGTSDHAAGVRPHEGGRNLSRSIGFLVCRENILLEWSKESILNKNWFNSEGPISKAFFGLDFIPSVEQCCANKEKQDKPFPL